MRTNVQRNITTATIASLCLKRYAVRRKTKGRYWAITAVSALTALEKWTRLDGNCASCSRAGPYGKCRITQKLYSRCYAGEAGCAVTVHDDSHTHEDRSRQMLAQSGQSTLNALLLMNGGAVAAFLTFLTPLIEEGEVQPEFISAFSSFIYGLLAVVSAFATIHLCILASVYKWKRASNSLYVVTVALCFASAFAFLLGVFQALHAVQSA